MPLTIDVGVGVVLSADGKRVLACQRRLDDYWGGWWEFPGGKREPDEPIEACVQREILEEVGLHVIAFESLQSFEFHYADRDRLVHVHPWLCRTTTPAEPRALEVECFRWCNADELAALRFLPANEALIRTIVSRLTR